MNKKILFISIFILMIVLSIGAVSAEDADDAIASSDDDTVLEDSESTISGTVSGGVDVVTENPDKVSGELSYDIPDDARTIDGDISGATAQPLSKDLGDWTTMEVTFTVSGANAAATEAPATTAEAPAAGDVAAATDSSKGSPDTGIEDVAVIAGLAVLAGGAALVAGKRK